MAKKPKRTRIVKAKKKCCRSRPRCKRCPVTCKRLAKMGKAERDGKRTWVLIDVGKQDMRSARAR